jgi:hypothetical protein
MLDLKSWVSIMDTLLSPAPQVAAGYALVRQRRIEKNLARFPRAYRTQVKALADSHRAFADLAVSFPALLFVAAVPHKGRDGAALREMIIAGHALKVIARVAHLPMWARRLQPEAFAQTIGSLPNSEVYARQIANHLPRRSKHAAKWLDRVSKATMFGDEAFAVWVARELSPPHWTCDVDLKRLALWAWFSLRTDSYGHQFATKPWRPQTRRNAANRAARDFIARICLHVTIADAAVKPLWIANQSQDGYEFLPLLCANDLHEEADAMENCVASYGRDIADDEQRLWSMRKDGKRVATLSVGFDYDLELLCITQIKGRNNSQVPRPVAVAAQRWF